jgi:hypothetical protein
MRCAAELWAVHSVFPHATKAPLRHVPYRPQPFPMDGRGRWAGRASTLAGAAHGARGPVPRYASPCFLVVCWRNPSVRTRRMHPCSGRARGAAMSLAPCWRAAGVPRADVARAALWLAGCRAIRFSPAVGWGRRCCPPPMGEVGGPRVRAYGPGCTSAVIRAVQGASGRTGREDTPWSSWSVAPPWTSPYSSHR